MDGAVDAIKSALDFILDNAVSVDVEDWKIFAGETKAFTTAR